MQVATHNKATVLGLLKANDSNEQYITDVSAITP